MVEETAALDDVYQDRRILYVLEEPILHRERDNELDVGRILEDYALFAGDLFFSDHALAVLDVLDVQSIFVMCLVYLSNCSLVLCLLPDVFGAIFEPKLLLRDHAFLLCVEVFLKLSTHLVDVVVLTVRNSK